MTKRQTQLRPGQGGKMRGPTVGLTVATYSLYEAKGIADAMVAAATAKVDAEPGAYDAGPNPDYIVPPPAWQWPFQREAGLWPRVPGVVDDARDRTAEVPAAAWYKVGDTVQVSRLGADYDNKIGRILALNGGWVDITGVGLVPCHDVLRVLDAEPEPAPSHTFKVGDRVVVKASNDIHYTWHGVCGVVQERNLRTCKVRLRPNESVGDCFVLFSDDDLTAAPQPARAQTPEPAPAPKPVAFDPATVGAGDVITFEHARYRVTDNDLAVAGLMVERIDGVGSGWRGPYSHQILAKVVADGVAKVERAKPTKVPGVFNVGDRVKVATNGTTGVVVGHGDRWVCVKHDRGDHTGRWAATSLRHEDQP